MKGRPRRPPHPLPEEDLKLLREPGWAPLVELARSQAGVFMQRQALDCGLELSVLRSLLQSGRLHRVQRLLFRLTREPDPLEPLALAWLWTGRHGVFSHRTALVLHGLVPALDADEVHLTVPLSWPGRCRSVPGRVHLHGEDLPRDEVVRIGAYPVVCVERALQFGLMRLERAEVRRVLTEVARRGLLEEPSGP